MSDQEFPQSIDLSQPIVGPYDFQLPDALIAQRPAEVRGLARSDARLLVVDRSTRSVRHAQFVELAAYLETGDTIVVNNAQVVSSIIRATNAMDEPIVINVFSPMDDGTWHGIVVPAQESEVPQVLTLQDGSGLTLLHQEAPAVWRVAFQEDPIQTLDRLGQIAYPDYLNTDEVESEWYQTIFAEVPGATLFPSAARHFTPDLVEQLRKKGIEVTFVTHFIAARWQPAYLVRLLGQRAGDGPVTYVPLEDEETRLPFPRSERYSVSTTTADLINKRRRAGGRVIVCGTSAMRALETVVDRRTGRIWPGTGWTDLILGPEHKFMASDGFITNFHMPRSSELRLTSGLVDREWLLDLYRTVIVPERYLFNEFGDSMLIL